MKEVIKYVLVGVCSSHLSEMFSILLSIGNFLLMSAISSPSLNSSIPVTNKVISVVLIKNHINGTARKSSDFFL